MKRIYESFRRVFDDVWYLTHAAGVRGHDLTREESEAFHAKYGDELRERLTRLRNAQTEHDAWLDAIVAEWVRTAAPTGKGE